MTVSSALRLGFMVVPPKPGHRPLTSLLAWTPARRSSAARWRAYPREGYYLRPFRHMKRVCAWRRERMLRWLGEIASGSTRVKATAGLVVVVLMPR
jgi:DNA-binding transcriptional MocR family regulator